MTPSDLDRIDTTLQIRLPSDYRHFMEAYPFSPNSMGADMLMDDPDVLLQWNRTKNAALSQQTVPSAEYFQIGFDGGELKFFIKLSGSSNPIYCYDLELGSLIEYSQNIAEYAERCGRIDAGSESLPNETTSIPEPVKWLLSLGLLLLLILFGYGVFQLARWLLK